MRVWEVSPERCAYQHSRTQALKGRRVRPLPISSVGAGGSHELIFEKCYIRRTLVNTPLFVYLMLKMIRRHDQIMSWPTFRLVDISLKSESFSWHTHTSLHVGPSRSIIRRAGNRDHWWPFSRRALPCRPGRFFCLMSGRMARDGAGKKVLLLLVPLAKALLAAILFLLQKVQGTQWRCGCRSDSTLLGDI